AAGASASCRACEGRDGSKLAQATSPRTPLVALGGAQPLSTQGTRYGRIGPAARGPTLAIVSRSGIIDCARARPASPSERKDSMPDNSLKEAVFRLLPRVQTPAQ